MNKLQVVFPHQLFHEKSGFSKEYPILLCEDPLFYFDKHSPARFHKQKLVYQRAAMKKYADYLANQGYNTTCLDYKSIQHHTEYIFHYAKEQDIEVIEYHDTVDFLLEKRLQRGAGKYNIKIIKLRTPNFINSYDEIESFFKNKKKFFLTKFYIEQRKRYNILLDKFEPVGGKWSFDPENRKKLPKNIEVPDVSFGVKDKYYKEAEEYVNLNFPDNPGEIGNVYYPIDRVSALEHLEIFFGQRFKLYGEYQDAIAPQYNWLFHSVISPMLNIGLLTPDEIISKAEEYYRKHDIPINSVEGFIRQILGWREFTRGIYISSGVKMRNNNFFEHSNPIPDSFYSATTGIQPVDDAIRKVLQTSYNHHIERLMILGNFMMLCEINPNDIYKWFMEMYIDSYDWVMVPNGYGMSQFTSGGIMSTKPYISSSNYIIKMSDYKRGEWSEIWDALYWRFIDKNRGKLSSNPRMKFILAQHLKMGDKLSKHLETAEKFLTDFIK